MGDVDYTLRRQVDQVQGMVLRLEQGVGQVGVQVAQVGQRADEANDRLQKLTQAFEEYRRQAERDTAIQRAETRIGVVEAQIEHRFGHHKVVRRVATGLLEAFDVGIVSDEAMREVSERLMIETRQYWLAPVLVALRAWITDDQVTCERAVQEAFRRSQTRTSLFMALVLRRQDRGESALRWLRHFLAALDPNALGREFAMVLECIAKGAFGPAGIEVVQERLDLWREQLGADPAKQQAQVARWRAELERHVGPSSTARFPRLAAVSPQWPQMDAALARASAHDSLIARYSAMAAEEITPPDRIEDQVDEILDFLVTNYDEEELPLRREHAEHQAVVQHGGDHDAARRHLDTDLLALDTKLDFLTIQSESALNPDKLGVSPATQRMAVSSCHEWFAQAHAAYSRDYRAGLPQSVDVVLEGTHNAAGVAFRLPRWVGSLNRPVAVLERSLADHWDRAAHPFIAGLAYRWGQQLIAPIAVTTVLFLCAVAALPYAIPVVLIGGGIWFLVLWMQSQSAVRRQQEVAALLNRAKQDSLQQLRGAVAEVTDWTSAFRQADSREPAVRTLITELATAGNAAAPYERRVARAGAHSAAEGA